MEHLNILMNALFSVILAPFRGLNHWYGMVAVSIISALILLSVFKATSNRRAIRRNKNRAIARLLELMLFKDDIVVNLGALGRTMLANAAYMGSMVRPMLFGIVPFALLLAQVSVWFACKPLQPGEPAVVKAVFSEHARSADADLAIEASAGVTVETPVVRIPSRGEAAWRVRAVNNGFESVDVLVNGARERKTVAVGTAPRPVSPVRVQAGFWRQLAAPAETPLPAASPLARIEVVYQQASFAVAGFNFHWLLVYVVLTMLLAWALKGPFRVEI
ncbi:MAG: hypothetical protein WCL44_05050 [bacterium]